MSRSAVGGSPLLRLNTTLVSILLAVLLHKHLASAYPDKIRYDSTDSNGAKVYNCLLEPDPKDSGLQDNHGTVEADAVTTAFIVTADDGKTLLNKKLCPGMTHSVKVQFTKNNLPDKRRGFVTATQGSFVNISTAGYGLAKGCTNRMFMSPQGRSYPGKVLSDSAILTEYSLQLVLPCSAQGTVKLSSFSSRQDCGSCGGNNHIRAASITSTIDPTCATVACGGQGPAEATTPQGTGAATTTPVPQQPDASTVPTSDAVTPTPSPSSQTQTNQDTNSGTPVVTPQTTPADTGSTTTTPGSAGAADTTTGTSTPATPADSTNAAGNTGDASLAGPAKQTTTPGTCSSTLGYGCSGPIGKLTVHWTIGGLAPPNNLCTGPDAASKPLLTQADLGSTQLIHYAVEGPSTGYVALGFGHNNQDMDPTDIVLGWAEASGQGTIKVYHVTQTDISEDDAYPDGQLYGASVMQDGSARTITCFSRKADDPRWEESPQMDLTTADWNFVWALDNSDGLEQHRSGNYGGGSINGLTGSTTSVSAGNKEKAIRAHGILMTVAWALLLPLGTLLPAHRWVLGGWLWRGKAMWFWLHQFFQLTGLALFVAGFAVAFAEFPSPEGSITKSHAYIGYTIIGMAGLQLCSGYARPDPTHALRPMWNLVHINWGRITVLLSWANIFIGIVAFQQSVYAEEIAPWVAPIAACMAFMLGVDLALRMVRPAAGDSKAAFIAMGSLVRGKPGGAGNPALAPSPTMPNNSNQRFGSVTKVGLDGSVYTSEAAAPPAAANGAHSTTTSDSDHPAGNGVHHDAVDVRVQ